ncbi:hypothetical protein ACFY3U_22350 [Micromonospora sp. NPDC000089]|uniref:hypothetical protein n=1 Tax=unclassified Micromonospora TaxID=2617518 RepID=UPI00368E34BB
MITWAESTEREVAFPVRTPARVDRAPERGTISPIGMAATGEPAARTRAVAPAADGVAARDGVALAVDERAFDGVTLARDGAAFDLAGAALARDGAAFAGVAFARDGAAFARDGAALARDGPALDGAAFARDGVALARDADAFDGAAFALDGVALARDAAALDGVALAREGAALRGGVALRAGAGAAFARAEVAVRPPALAAAVFLLAGLFFAAVFLVLAARPAGPVLRRPAPPRPSDRRVRASVFTSSGLRRVEIPLTPRRRSWPRMSSAFIWEMSDSEIPGVFGVWLPALVLVAVPPRPELLR